MVCFIYLFQSVFTVHFVQSFIYTSMNPRPPALNKYTGGSGTSGRKTSRRKSDDGRTSRRNKCGTLGRLGGTRFVRSIWRPESRESLLPEPPSLPGTLLLHPGTWSTALPALWTKPTTTRRRGTESSQRWWATPTLQSGTSCSLCTWSNPTPTRPWSRSFTVTSLPPSGLGSSPRTASYCFYLWKLAGINGKYHLIIEN